MVITKMLAASVVGALAFSSGVTARDLQDDEHAPATTEASAECTVFAFGGTEVDDGPLIVSASAAAIDYVCNGVGSADDIASETAYAFASAVAGAAVACKQEGDTTVKVDAKAEAAATAKVWAKSYFDAFASAVTCDKCEAFASSWGYIEKHIVLKVAADASVHLDSVTSDADPGVLVTSIMDYDSEIKKVFASAFASALTAAADFKKEEACFAFVNAGGCIWTEGHEDEVNFCAECSAGALSVASVDSINAIATASASAASWSCGDAVAIADAEVTASALASATAEAVSLAFAGCAVTDGGAHSDSFVCADSFTEVAVWVDAVAKAYAKSWALALTCDCKAQVDNIVKAVGTILLDAATEAYAGFCASGEGVWLVADFEAQIKEAYLCAIAEANAIAIAAPGFCLAAGISYAGAEAGQCPGPHPH